MTRGHLALYLGPAPGVGKTIAMLAEGRRRSSRGTDVVVGAVDTHGRRETANQLGDLEIIPPLMVTHEGHGAEEMDVEAIVARAPQVVLVDDLGHVNAPGSPHSMRWEDVDELLTMGLEVISTIDIQQIESLRDVVERITGYPQFECVPDTFVRAAHRVELVDMAPESLRRRLAHGNVYPAHAGDVALANFFRPANLAALRKLAFLWMANRVDTELETYRTRHGIAEPWETKEVVAVALTGAPGGDDLVRRAARMANRMGAELVGIHVKQSGAEPASPDGARTLSTPARGPGVPGDALSLHRHVLEDVGGRYVEVRGRQVAEALVDSARAEGATQLVLGTPRPGRFDRLRHRSIVSDVLVRASGHLDVLIIGTR